MGGVSRGVPIAQLVSMTRHYEALVIGDGQASPPLAGRMNDEGMKVAIIER
jgi:pyruvate/2-oxoglutarate dehydrogenase complex dihydrolipoamide dehydrogenase (E3) component